ncbi:unnamed protein product, partial [Ectocarpus sp. 12 AP-2014]
KVFFGVPPGAIEKATRAGDNLLERRDADSAAATPGGLGLRPSISCAWSISGWTVVRTICGYSSDRCMSPACGSQAYITSHGSIAKPCILTCRVI